ncbi:hypothetical protein AUEXF2481DRAFT_38544 [Aureobasidium subglaciale EXF-2481]|uniref:Uncharacterized protein n=1 Tax=Aureobasidium subglaciale (strain EXF-2481) TaxID=1043005 RepID=A0A074YHI0_AURSE|nr:uncharacterized protein AUEXF2481DRAFT_38544 [Aureobasidium subglaciale EXF-2481]KEQ97145.1 hypothetical protein AUEXF2481DRAFT_38544 [Aureobasidium subglaciale EXF-2481]
MAPSPVQSSTQSRPRYTRSKSGAQVALIRAKRNKQQPIPTYDPSKHGFLDLPGEARNLIYDLVVQDMPCAGTLNLYTFRIPTPSMALACKEIFGEVMGYVVQNLSFAGQVINLAVGLTFPSPRLLCSLSALVSIWMLVPLLACTSASDISISAPLALMVQVLSRSAVTGISRSRTTKLLSQPQEQMQRQTLVCGSGRQTWKRA